MSTFMDDDFLLGSGTAKKLFAVAATQPIFDFHCHLSPKEICEDRPFQDLAELWLGGDHYKWRVMRSFGIEEKYITGDGSNREKFAAWARVAALVHQQPPVPLDDLELRRYFGIDDILCPETAEDIWEKANRKIRAEGFTRREIIKASRVAALCTTDDPADPLEYHQKLAADPSFGVRVLPAFRPDKALNAAAAGYGGWIKKLGAAAGVRIAGFGDLKAALSRRVGFFAERGCVASDHGLIYVPFRRAGDAEAERIFRKAVLGAALSPEELDAYQTELLLHLAAEYHRHGIAMELHLGAMRNNNTRIFQKLGPDTGFDSVHDHAVAEPLSRFLDCLDAAGSLPKTILFTSNPRDNYVLGTMLGNFQSPEAAGKLQFGCAWWFNDHIDGMRKQLRDLANLGGLGKFIGMVTDSRSFLSYPRHEYFRRILCNLLGDFVEHGEYPADERMLEEIVRGISFQNAADYFGIRL